MTQPQNASPNTSANTPPNTSIDEECPPLHKKVRPSDPVPVSVEYTEYTPTPAPELKREVNDDPFVKDPGILLNTLLDMHTHEEAFMFRNRDDDITCMIRSTSEATDELMSFELLVITDPDKDMHAKFKSIMSMEYTVLPDDDGHYIMDSITVSRDATPEDMDEAVDSINAMYDLRICECYQALVKSKSLDLCYICAISRDPSKSSDTTCIICTDPIHTTRGIRRMACCNQCMHAKCYERWRSEEEKKTCPVCRH
jgi:hypothetical protein